MDTQNHEQDPITVAQDLNALQRIAWDVQLAEIDDAEDRWHEHAEALITAMETLAEEHRNTCCPTHEIIGLLDLSLARYVSLLWDMQEMQAYTDSLIDRAESYGVSTFTTVIDVEAES